MAVVVCGTVLMLLGGGSIANVHKRCCIAHCQLSEPRVFVQAVRCVR